MMKRKITKTDAVISMASLMLALSANMAAAQQNLLNNGSFETGPAGLDSFPGWDQFGPASENSDYGTTNSTIFPDVAEDGTNYAYFHGHPTDDSQDCLGQTVNLTVGAQYTFSCYLGTDGPTLGSGAAMWAVVGSSFGIDYEDDLQLVAFLPNSPNAIPYQKFTTNFTATLPTEILSFHGVDGASSILLDNVTLTLLPPAPLLSVSLSPTNTLVFSWTSSTPGFQLQVNPTLGTTNWQTLTNAPVTNGSNNQLVLPAPGSNLFYRLELPPS